MKQQRGVRRICVIGLALVGAAALLGACGGGTGGGPGPEGAGQGLVLSAFNIEGLDNVPINRTFVFTFSEAVDPTTVYSVDASGHKVGTGSIQVRRGPQFGIVAFGEFDAIGNKVYFTPRLPTRRLVPGETPVCDFADAGLQPGTDYQVTVQGHPEYLAIRNTRGQPLNQTRTFEFHTAPEDDPAFIEDQVPGASPAVVSTLPVDQTPNVPVGAGTKIGGGVNAGILGTPDVVEIELSENVNPCTIDTNTVRMHVYEEGDLVDGFVPTQDSAPGNDYTWGSTTATALSPERLIPSIIELDQSVAETKLFLTPCFGRFPENALVVVELLAGIEDFGGNSLVPSRFSFTTENLNNPAAQLRVEYDQTTPIVASQTSAAVNLPSVESKAQGFVNIAGDGDNGPSLTTPTFPASLAPDICVYKPNDGADDFEPTADVFLDTGATVNTCPNMVDGSTAVVFEFNSFTINPGVTVEIVGVNPVILLVAGPVEIKAGGVLLFDGKDGENGRNTTSRYQPPPPGAAGGKGVAGGGDGGDSRSPPDTTTWPDPNGWYGNDGWAGYGSPDWPNNAEGGMGSGQGNVSVALCVYPSAITGSSSPSGGGGGHGGEGNDGTAYVMTPNCHQDTPRGAGGEIYKPGAAGDMMLSPSAGSGGGAAGYCLVSPATNLRQGGEFATGGAGGGGGGFVDITSSSSIKVYGTISGRGGRGGDGGVSYFIDTGDTGGGGGGSGGGLRLLTPGSIDVTGGTIDLGGGFGGTGYVSIYLNGGAQPNHGGTGGAGRLVMEDSDGTITGQGSASLVPTEGEDGFFRGQFQADRFVGGGLTSQAVTEPMFVGPLTAPDFHAPTAADFDAGFPGISSPGFGATGVLIEVQGYPLLPDGTPDLGTPTGWWTVGYMSDSGDPGAPTWVPNANPTDVAIPTSNAGVGIDAIDGSGFVQVRLTFYLANGTPVGTGGPFVDRWDMRFNYEDL